MNPYILLAKSAVENYIKQGKIISPAKDLPEEFLTKKAGVFVTIEKQGHLKGCIGTYLPTRPNIAQEIISNSISAALEDYRFNPVQEQELSELSYTVYVLDEPKIVKNLKKLNPKKHGIIVKTAPFTYPNKKPGLNNKNSFKSGLLLPDLPGIEKVEDQLAIACEKAGIDPTKEKMIVYSFTVQKYEEEK